MMRIHFPSKKIARRRLAKIPLIMLIERHRTISGSPFKREATKNWLAVKRGVTNAYGTSSKYQSPYLSRLSTLYE